LILQVSNLVLGLSVPSVQTSLCLLIGNFSFLVLGLYVCQPFIIGDLDLVLVGLVSVNFFVKSIKPASHLALETRHYLQNLRKLIIGLSLRLLKNLARFVAYLLLGRAFPWHRHGSLQVSGAGQRRVLIILCLACLPRGLGLD
jgi:hypothetical protein